MITPDDDAPVPVAAAPEPWTEDRVVTLARAYRLRKEAKQKHEDAMKEAELWSEAYIHLDQYVKQLGGQSELE